MEKSEIRFFFRFSWTPIFHVNLITLKKIELMLHAKKNIYCSKFQIFFFPIFNFEPKIRNRLNREKNQISDISFFYFSSYVNFCDVLHPNFRWNFTITRKIKIVEFFKLFFPLYSAYSTSFMKFLKFDHFWGGGGGSAYP